MCADTMFNGYGTTRGDFMKQVHVGGWGGVGGAYDWLACTSVCN